MNDEQYMHYALELAERARGRTSPNPMVGAVIVKDGQIVGRGWHRRAGTPHAEIYALQEAGSLAAGATLYVTLEPCVHYGRTGPCADALIQAGIGKAVVAMTDPNPLVAGAGIARLRAAGVEVVEGLLSQQAAKLNEVFIKWMAAKLPFGVLKTAVTLDGKIATYTGHSQWITGKRSRQRVHELRDRYDAILTGLGTVVADDPQLTARLPQGNNPLRVVADSLARTPLTAKVVTDQQAATIIAVTPSASAQRVAALRRRGVEVLTVAQADTGGIDLYELSVLLGQRGITSLLIEGGAKINAAALAAHIVDKVHWFVAPKLVGGADAPGPVGGIGIGRLEDAYLLEEITTEGLGEDILISAYLLSREGRDVYRACGRIGQD